MLYTKAVFVKFPGIMLLKLSCTCTPMPGGKASIVHCRLVFPCRMGYTESTRPSDQVPLSAVSKLAPAGILKLIKALDAVFKPRLVTMIVSV